MEKKLFSNNYGHVKLCPKLRRLLFSCMEKEQTRYALNGVSVQKEGFTVTDGLRLFHIDIKHNLEAGMYILTTDGYLLLAKNMGRFPKWEDVVPEKAETEGKACSLGANKAISYLVYNINQNKKCIDLDLFLPVLRLLGDIDAEVQAYKTKPDMPEKLTGTIMGNQFVFVIMPAKIQEV